MTTNRATLNLIFFENTVKRVAPAILIMATFGDFVGELRLAIPPLFICVHRRSSAVFQNSDAAAR
jgi:hypothetical protein